MGRTESTSFQVHPKDEQEQINFMQKFHWNLLNSQEIKTVDSHMERRGGSIYSVTKSEHYVKLIFSRELDLPNLTEIKRLEQQFYSLSEPKEPQLFPGTILPWLIAALFWGIGILAWLAYFFLIYKPNKETYDKQKDQYERTRSGVFRELEKYN